MNIRLLLVTVVAGALAACAAPQYRDQNPDAADTGAVIVGEEPPATDEDEYFRTDAQIHDDVHEVLQRAGFDYVTVRVVDSDVFLGGHVHSLDQRDDAHDLAHDVLGVEEVFVDEVDIQ